jgi:uncharacterized protein DUF1553/uncharacterized protein DUF1549/cytochrome c/concanavalin A-like lectin/glucanase superfamily protein
MRESPPLLTLSPRRRAGEGTRKLPTTRTALQFTRAALCVACLSSLAFAADETSPREIRFNRDVRPILSDKCWACHGPDVKTRQADLRLDTDEGAKTVRDGHAAIVPGDPTTSELVRRIRSADADEVMPPSKHPKQLTAAEKSLLEEWIKQGAKYEGHWAFVPMQRPKPPRVSPENERRVINTIDRFVLHEMEQHGLKTLAPEATKQRLIRRVTFDLTGLPPTPAEVEAFVRDPSPEAYERVIDRLLKSARYGERMASEWLDVARYADTHGYQFDRTRPTWPYRDWVISAFNDNLPFDQFATWQLAGDLLPNATKAQKLATAFNRMHCQNEEGGVVEEEFRVAYVVDRVDTFGTAFLGLTFECSRCHDHKYDPLTQRDFYSLFSFFQNIDEFGQTSYFTGSTPVPTVLLSTDAQDAALAALDRKIVEKEQTLAALRDSAKSAFGEWLNSKPERPAAPSPLAAFSFDALESFEKKQLVNSIDAAKPGKASDGPKLIAGRTGQAAELNGDNGFTFPGLGHFTRADPFSLAIAIQPTLLTPRAVIVHHSRAPADAGSRGYELMLEEGRVAFGLHHMWPGNSLKVRTQKPLVLNEWSHVTVTYDGSSRAAGVRLYVNGQLATLDVIRDGLWKDIIYDGGEPELAIGFRFRDAGFKGGRVDDFAIFGRELTTLEAAHVAGRDDLKTAWTTKSDSLFETFLATAHVPWQQALQKLQSARDEQRRLINPIPEIMAMREMPAPKPAFILKRGSYDQPLDAVTADTPRVLPPFPVDAPRNRLGLARWLTDPEHPLMARVTVNRLWQTLLGRGLVETSDNLGSQGALPTHPELLDWLARDFIASGWDTKRMVKLIAMSAVYRQGSEIGRPGGKETRGTGDIDNRWLSHAPVRRLTAEMLRDQALFAGGLLVDKIGGPSVKPYQPAGLWDIAMGKPQYDQSHGPDLYRRSVYTFWKRTVPPPAPMTFDAADRSYCTVRRQSTSTPLQALTLLNDPQIVESARFVAQRMLKEGGDTTDSQVAWAFRLITSRPPTSRETAILMQLYSEQRADFAADLDAANKFLAVGEAKPDAALAPADLAAGAVVALAILNHDEAVNRR